jgi:N-acetylglucosamine kinase-like BadF-type ATPase
VTASSTDAGGLALGGDLGGTSTRILVTDLAGQPLGRGRAGGGNPTAHPATARDALASALAQALRDVDPVRVRAGVLGMAGGGALRDPSVRAAYDEAWRAAGLPGLPDVRSDVEIAFAAGSDATTGTVLVAGTGAVAGRVEAGRLVATTGGHGWLLGDEGSGFWLGREAVRAALRWVGSDEEPGPLVRSVLAVLPESDDARTALVQHAYAGPPVALASLAPLVTAANDGGDPLAAEIVATGLAHLIALLDRLPTPSPGEPVVLAGALTERGTAIGHGLRRHLGQQGLDVLSAAEPVTGAAAIARRQAAADPRDQPG